MAKIDLPTRQAFGLNRPVSIIYRLWTSIYIARQNDSTAADRIFYIPAGCLKNRSLSQTTGLGLRPLWLAAFVELTLLTLLT
jgi:hypothetical protein